LPTSPKSPNTCFEAVIKYHSIDQWLPLFLGGRFRQRRMLGILTRNTSFRGPFLVGTAESTDMSKTSHSLLDQIQLQPSPDSWERLVKVYTPLLSSWLRRYDVFSPADVDDLVQDVLLAVSKDLSGFEHNGQPGAFRAWMRTILANRVRKFWRSRQRWPMAVGGSDFLNQIADLEDNASQASGLWNRDHDQHVLRHLISIVKPRFAEQTWLAFQRQVFDGLKAPQVAEELGLSLDSVYAAKSRVLLALRTSAGTVM
ncbi:MAG: RNA polymerase sigma factor, partial [Planctomycetaceae bacterium]